MSNVKEIQLQDVHAIKEAAQGAGIRSGSFFDTEVVFSNGLGEELFTQKNIIVTSGRKFILEKLFNTTLNDPAQDFQTLNEYYSDPRVPADDNDDAVGPRKSKNVCLFGIGIGGASKDRFGQVYKPSGTEFDLYNPIPFQMVEGDANSQSAVAIESTNKYYMRTVNNGNTAYYLKEFEVQPKIFMKHNGSDFTPAERIYGEIADTDPLTVLNTVVNENVEIYVEIKLKITTDDARAYFDLVEANPDMARINELGLYFGFQQPVEVNGLRQWSDYYDVECFSKLTFNNEPLDTEKEINITYRIFA